MTIDTLERYELASLAQRMSEDKGRMQYTIKAMSNLYKKFGVDKGDPIINKALAEAAAGLAKGHITNASVFQAIELYHEKYDQAVVKSTVSDFMKYVGDKGYKDTPTEIKELTLKYNTFGIGDLAKEAKKAKDAGEEDKAKEITLLLNTIYTLQNQVMEGILYPNLVKSATNEGLEGIVKEVNELKAAA